MSVPLEYLGEHESIEQCERARGPNKSRWSFGWVTHAWNGRPPILCFVGWIPGKQGQPIGMIHLPVYRPDQELPPETEPFNLWKLTGPLESPTLRDSVARQIRKPVEGPLEEIAHGFITDGEWHPC